MNDAKRKILARRAQFVAAALAGLGADACGKNHADKPDATVAQPPPTPCLAVPLTPPARPRDAGAEPDAAPHPCLGGSKPTP